MGKSLTSYILIGQCLMAGLLVILMLRFFESRVSHRDAQINLARAQTLAKKIARLREFESVAQEGAQKPDAGNQLLAELASDSGIGRQQMRSIQRQPPSTIEETEYVREDIVLDLQGVTVQQIVKLVLDAEAKITGMKATSLGITSVSGGVPVSAENSNQPELWNAQLVLTQLAFVATSAN